MTLYSLSDCEKLMNTYLEKGGEVVTVEEGVLGLGLVVCWGEGLKTTIITERYLNSWSSAHTIRMYNKMPKKYDKMLDEIWEEKDREDVI